MAVAKRAKDELASREAALRTLLQQERDKQLQVSAAYAPSWQHAADATHMLCADA